MRLRRVRLCATCTATHTATHAATGTVRLRWVRLCISERVRHDALQHSLRNIAPHTATHTQRTTHTATRTVHLRGVRLYAYARVRPAVLQHSLQRSILQRHCNTRCNRICAFERSKALCVPDSTARCARVERVGLAVRAMRQVQGIRRAQFLEPACA